MHPPDRFTCEEVFARLDDYLDRELTAEEMQLVRDHLATCAACASEYRFEAGVLEGVREKLRRLAVPADLMARISARIAAEGGDR
ncbi:MAG TPA: zf-HC2 domain-containing protein [Gemmatimonadales bacterium]|nr:zf-HC2 domain-containing protein [Gemmatimonadales bacterium]